MIILVKMINILPNQNVVYYILGGFLFVISNFHIVVTCINCIFFLYGIPFFHP